MDKDNILVLDDKPAEMEALYRSHPDQFQAIFPDALASKPHSLLLQTWQERLFFVTGQDTGGMTNRALVITIMLSIIATVLVKLGQFSIIIDSNWYTPRFTAPLIISAIALYYLSQYRPTPSINRLIVGTMVASLLYSGLLPSTKESDTALLAILYIPFILWSGVYLSYAGENWRSSELRMNFIRYSGELVVISAVILLGGMVLTGLTFALFKLINVNIDKFYMNYVVVWGLVSSPIVATYLIDKVMQNKLRISAILAKVFAPIFLITVIAYLTAMFIEQKSPYSDREFLLTFNILLLIVLAIAAFSISEYRKQQSSDLVNVINIALIGVTLIIDLIALSAIVYRLSSFGITPNRIAVLGTNLIIFVNLIGILKNYIQVLSEKCEHIVIEQDCARYLPVYTIWSIFVALALPLIFWFK